MRKLSAWFTLGSFVLLGSGLAVGCGSDEATDDDDDDGGGSIIDGGSEGGTVRDSGTSSGPSRVGRTCSTDAECGAEDDLFCVTEDDLDTFGAAPANGICTKECGADDDCPEGGICSLGYCFEGCEPGESGSSTGDKCHAREEVVCTIMPRDGTCQLDGDCLDGEVCAGGQCWIFGCQPNCGSDADCAAGLFCDFDFGFCVEEAPEGKEITEACDPGLTMDECKGFCIANDDTEETGFCSAICNLGSPVGCGWDGEGPAEAACLFATGLVPEPGPNDIGLCGQLCDCNTECAVEGDLCDGLDLPQLEEFWGRKGYCRPPTDTFGEADSLGECPDTGGGTGGAPGTGAAGSPSVSPSGGAGGEG